MKEYSKAVRDLLKESGATLLGMARATTKYGTAL